MDLTVSTEGSTALGSCITAKGLSVVGGVHSFFVDIVSVDSEDTLFKPGFISFKEDFGLEGPGASSKKVLANASEVDSNSFADDFTSSRLDVRVGVTAGNT